ncbi:MAG: hypothetical protein PV344_03225, partial [Anaplasma sp.]|nr:hypothetical protein [Anaplasma sp.]
VLMTQHSSFPSLVSSVSGSQPKGRGFKSRLKFFKFFIKANELLYKVKSFEACGDFEFALHVIFQSLTFHHSYHLLITVHEWFEIPARGHVAVTSRPYRPIPDFLVTPPTPAFMRHELVKGMLNRNLDFTT